MFCNEFAICLQNQCSDILFYTIHIFASIMKRFTRIPLEKPRDQFVQSKRIHTLVRHLDSRVTNYCHKPAPNFCFAGHRMIIRSPMLRIRKGEMESKSDNPTSQHIKEHVKSGSTIKIKVENVTSILTVFLSS